MFVVTILKWNMYKVIKNALKMLSIKKKLFAEWVKIKI